MKSDIPYGFYNVGRGIKTSIKELTEILLKLAGSDLPIRYDSDGQTFVTNRVGEPGAAKRDLGFEWTVDLEDGLQRLIKWRQNNMDVVNRNKKEKN